MAIDTSGKWWRGENAADLAQYLEENAAGGYPIDRTVQAVCAGCAGQAFRLRADDEEGAVERVCPECGQVLLMLDSGDHWEDTEPAKMVCECGAEVFEVIVGFSLRADDEVRWVSIGTRCIADGALGCCADWKIDYSPSSHLPGLV
jgi:hypothetical protein